MKNIYAKKGEKVYFNGRYDILPEDFNNRVFHKNEVYTIAEDIDPGDSYSYVKLVEFNYSMGFNTVAFENVVKKPILKDDLPDTIDELQHLMQLCETKIHKIQYDKYKDLPCTCDRYTCWNCQQVSYHKSCGGAR